MTVTPRIVPFARATLRDPVPLLLAAVVFAAHAVGNPHYGFFRDELYFIACGRHPDFGYVDQPPLAPLFAAASQIFGPSLVALRLVSAACAGATVLVGCALVRELGGGRFATIVAALGIALAPVLTSFGTIVAPDSIAMPLWPLGALYVLRVTRGERRSWIGAGLWLGFAFEAKYSVVIFAFALIAGLVLTGRARCLLDGWFAAGAAIAVLIALPNAAWQAAHGFPMWELLRNGAAGKNVVLTVPQFLSAQLVLNNPLLCLIWIAGLGWTLTRPALRWLGAAYLVTIAVMLGAHGKDYYPATIYPIFFAAGGCAIERWTAGVRAVRPIAIGLGLVAGLALVPFVMPVLPLPAFIAYQSALHVKPTQRERMPLGVLPQVYADMIGWRRMTREIARVYARVPQRDRSRVMLYTANYGEAAALDFFGPRYGLPPATSHHNQYYLWGTRGFTNDDPIVISINVDPKDLAASFRSVREVEDYPGPPLALPLERDDPICISTGLRRPLAQAWPFTPKLYI